MRNAANPVGWGAGGWVIRVGAALLSVFVRRMLALSQGLWILCAEVGMGVAWRIQFQTHSSLFSRDRAILLAFRLLQYCDRVREVKPYSAERVALGYG